MGSVNSNENNLSLKLEEILINEDEYFVPFSIDIEDLGSGLLLTYIGFYFKFDKWIKLEEGLLLNLNNLIKVDSLGNQRRDCVPVPNSYYLKFKGNATLEIMKKILGKCLDPQLDKAYKRFKQLENDGTYSSEEKSPHLFNRLVLKYIFDTYQSLKIPLPKNYSNLSAVPKDKGYSKQGTFVHPFQNKSENRDILKEARLIQNSTKNIKVGTKSKSKSVSPPKTRCQIRNAKIRKEYFRLTKKLNKKSALEKLAKKHNRATSTIESILKK